MKKLMCRRFTNSMTMYFMFFLIGEYGTYSLVCSVPLFLTLYIHLSLYKLSAVLVVYNGMTFSLLSLFTVFSFRNICLTRLALLCSRRGKSLIQFLAY